MKEHIRIKKAAQAALVQGDFTKFFSLLSELDCGFMRAELAKEAVAVARSKHTVDALRNIALLEVDSLLQEDLFSLILNTLLAMQATDIAIGIVFQCDGSRLTTGQGWYLLAKAFLARADFESVSKTYRYLQQDFHCTDIARECLQQISPQQSLLLWLEWLDVYARNATYGLEGPQQAAVKALVDYPADLKPICQRLQNIPDTDDKKRLIRTVYLRLVVLNCQNKCSEWEAILPADSQNLMHLRALWVTGELNEVLNTLVDSEAKPFLERVVDRICTDSTSVNGKDVLSQLERVVQFAQNFHTDIYTIAIEKCFLQHRVDLTIQILPKLGNNLRLQMIARLVQLNLSQQQYEIILTYVDDNLLSIDTVLQHSYNYNIDLNKIPAILVQKERQRRADTLVATLHTDLANVRQVSKRHPGALEISQVFERLLAYRCFPEALTCCQKLVPSKQRDQYAGRLLLEVVPAENFQVAQGAVQLFQQKDNQVKRVALQNFLKNYRQRKYRAALNQLLKIRDVGTFSPLICMCANFILAEQNKPAAIQFLVSSGIFALTEGYASDDVVTQIKENVSTAIVRLYPTEQQCLAYLQQLHVLARSDSEHYVLNALLASNYLKTAVTFLNLCSGATHDKRMPESLKGHVEEYLKSRPPTKEILDILLLLNDGDFLDDLIRLLFRELYSNLTAEYIDLVVAIPRQNIRAGYLVDSISISISRGQPALARRAAAYLDDAARAAWLGFIAAIESRHPVQLLSESSLTLMATSSIYSFYILQHVIKIIAEQVSVEQMFEHLLKYKARLISCAKAKESKPSLDELYKISNEETRLTALFNCLLNQWYQTLECTDDYEQALVGIELLLKDLVKIARESMYQKLEALAISCATKGYYQVCFDAVDLLLAAKARATRIDYVLEKVFENFLKRNALKVAWQLLELLRGKISEYCLERMILSLCEQYFSKQQYDVVIQLLKLCQGTSSLSLREKVTAWIVALLEQGDIDMAWKFINAINEVLNEEANVKIAVKMLAKGYVYSASKRLDLIQTPSLYLSLQDKLKAAYLEKLQSLMGAERVDKLCYLAKRFGQYLQCRRAGKHSDANPMKDEIILELRGQLDKVFLAFYKDNFGEKPVRKGKEINIYFPVVPDTVGKPALVGLQDYLAYIEANDLDLRFSNLHAYLKHIQPLKNSDYQWLACLCRLANIHKHENDLPLAPLYAGNKINMDRFIIQAIDGVTEILIKLFNHKLTLEQLASFQFSRYLLQTECKQVAEEKAEQQKPLNHGERRDIMLAAPKEGLATPVLGNPAQQLLPEHKP